MALRRGEARETTSLAGEASREKEDVEERGPPTSEPDRPLEEGR